MPFSQTMILPKAGNGCYEQAFSGKSGDSESVARALRIPAKNRLLSSTPSRKSGTRLGAERARSLNGLAAVRRFVLGGKTQGQAKGLFPEFPMKKYSPQRRRVHGGFVQVAILFDFLCALCASAVRFPSAVLHKSQKNNFSRGGVRWSIRSELSLLFSWVF